MSIFYLFPFFIALTHQADFICPSQPITLDQAKTGSLPSSSSSLQLIPANYTCDYHFVIPVGYAVAFTFSTNYNYDTEEITFVDNLDRPYRLGTPMSNYPHWAVQPSAHVLMRTVTATSKVLVSYEYVDISKFNQVKYDTGNVLSLSSFQAQTFYTFNSKLNDSIVLQLSKPIDNLRTASSSYYIFDGPDITTSKMIGRLSEYLLIACNSTGSSISLVNFYTTRMNDYVIANNKNIINIYKSYTFTILANNPTYQQNDTNSFSGYSANTVYCVDCESLYLESIQFSDHGLIQLLPQTPTNSGGPLITYDGDDFQNSTQLPQIIPSKLFTILATQNYVTTRVGVSPNGWLTPSDGRKGYIFAPNSWMAQSQSFSYYFKSQNDYRYSMVFQTHDFDNSTNLEVTIGRDNSGVVLSKVINQQNFNFNDFSAVGTYMNVTYNGDNKSYLAIRYEMDLVSGASKCLVVMSILVTVMVYLN